MIPKKIHYCWFGGAPLPELAEKCIASWKKYCPDYEIVRWDESNYDINSIPYTAEAYAAKKWAFVSDYARFDILYKHGGVYFDTDVEVLKPLDKIIEQGAFMGVEQSSTAALLNAGLGMASPAASDIFREVLDSYKTEHFLNEDGTYNFKTVVVRVSDIFAKYGFISENKIQKVAGITIYPAEYFCPMSYETGVITITENTHTIHHYTASWIDEKSQKHHLFAQKMIQKFGLKWGKRIARIKNFPFRVKNKIKEKGLWGTFLWKIKKIFKK